MTHATTPPLWYGWRALVAREGTVLPSPRTPTDRQFEPWLVALLLLVPARRALLAVDRSGPGGVLRYLPQYIGTAVTGLLLPMVGAGEARGGLGREQQISLSRAPTSAPRQHLQLGVKLHAAVPRAQDRQQRSFVL